MEIARTGVILNTENYDACAAFYQDLFNLDFISEKEEENGFKLTCLSFGDSYLLIETEGFAKPTGKSIKENCTKLRFNVIDLEGALTSIKAHGVDAEITKNSWGNTINIYDPDGNRVGIREGTTF